MCGGVEIKSKKIINSIVDNLCNKRAYQLTNNYDIYKCIRVNTTDKCKHLKYFNNYYNIKNKCIEKYNIELEFEIGTLIAFLLCLVVLII